nr:hypothetical protein BaRGS_012141 [Batillaria attramentaria]
MEEEKKYERDLNRRVLKYSYDLYFGGRPDDIQMWLRRTNEVDVRADNVAVLGNRFVDDFIFRHTHKLGEYRN